MIYWLYRPKWMIFSLILKIIYMILIIILKIKLKDLTLYLNYLIIDNNLI